MQASVNKWVLYYYYSQNVIVKPDFINIVIFQTFRFHFARWLQCTADGFGRWVWNHITNWDGINYFKSTNDQCTNRYTNSRMTQNILEETFQYPVILCLVSSVKSLQLLVFFVSAKQLLLCKIKLKIYKIMRDTFVRP